MTAAHVTHGLAAIVGGCIATGALFAANAVTAPASSPPVGIIGSPATYVPDLAALPDACRPGRPCLVIRRR